MGKTITSPVKQFPGTVTIPERMTMPQVIAWDNSVKEQRVLLAQSKENEGLVWSDIDQCTIPVLCEIVEEWNIEGLFLNGETNFENFVGSPREASHDLVAWIGGEIRKVYNGETKAKKK